MYRVLCMLSPVQISSFTPFLVFRWVLSRRQASSKRWQARHLKDRFRKEALVQGVEQLSSYYSPGGFITRLSGLINNKIPVDSFIYTNNSTRSLQIDEKYRIFRSGQTVVDLVCIFSRQKTIISGTNSWFLGLCPGLMVSGLHS
jgi:hypothetical protein